MNQDSPKVSASSDASKKRDKKFQKKIQEGAITDPQAKKAAVLKLMKPTIADKFDKIDGACDYFYILEKENEQTQQEIQNKLISQQRLLNEGIEPSQEEPELEQHVMPRGYP
jgi:hypothetical protein